MATLPLAGIRILDIGTRIAAPFAATLLGDFGAEVIKVELPGTGDFMRSIGPFDERRLAVVGGGGAQQEVDHARPAQAARPGAVPRPGAQGRRRGGEFPARHARGMGARATTRWRAINPDLILTRASVYGQSGPYRDRPGLDRNGIGFGGLLYLTGYPDRPPVRPGVIISDYLTGVFNALAIMIALYHRDVHRGGGQSVDLALYESIFRILEHTLPAYDRLGIVRGREGNRLRNSAPLDNWETDDGQFICIVAAGDGLFPRLAKRDGPAELLDDPRFARRQARASPTATRSTPSSASGAGMHTAARDRGDHGRRRGAGDARLLDRRHRRRSALRRARGHRHRRRPDHRPGQACRPSTRACRRRPASIQRGAPKLGEHNEEIYGGLLGLSADDLAPLRADARDLTDSGRVRSTGGRRRARGRRRRRARPGRC